MTITIRDAWKAAHRFTRSMNRIQQVKQVNGLYPSYLPKEEYRLFLMMCNIAHELRAPIPDNCLSRRSNHANRVNKIVDRLNWCEQTTINDVKRAICTALRDLYML